MVDIQVPDQSRQICAGCSPASVDDYIQCFAGVLLLEEEILMAYHCP